VGKLRFLLGFFEKPGGRRGVFCGQSVVNCVVKMVNWRALNRAKKMRQVFRLYFQRPEGDDVGYESSGAGRVWDASNKSVAG
jgi:hypothetical protein